MFPSLMPKGVEHLGAGGPEGLRPDVSFVDAERR